MNNRKIIINKDEKEHFELLEEKKSALYNLIFVCEKNPLITNQELYKRFLNDIRQAEKAFTDYWGVICKQYNIDEPKSGYYLSLNYSNNTISYESENKTS